MTKVSKAQLSFLDMDQDWFSSPTAKPILNPEASQPAASPDQILRSFTVKLLSSMGVTPEGEDIEAAVKQGILQRQALELHCPEEYVSIAVEEAKKSQLKLFPDEICRAKSEWAPAARRIRVFLLKKEHPDWLKIWTNAEQDVMGGKADLLDYHLRPVNSEVFARKMQEIGDVNDMDHYTFPYTILAYTCIDEAEYDVVKDEWEKYLTNCSHEREPMQMANFLAIYGVYREYGSYQIIPSDLRFRLNLFSPSCCSNWYEIERMLNLESFPFRSLDAYALEDKERFPGNFDLLQKEETALQRAMHGGNYVG